MKSETIHPARSILSDAPRPSIAPMLCWRFHGLVPCGRPAIVRHKRPGTRGWRYACNACFTRMTEHVREPLIVEHLEHEAAAATE